MHPNPKFRRTPEVKNIEFVRERSFGVLAVNSERAPLISHIPFQLSADGAYLEAHLVRVNPIVRLLTNPIKAVIAVTGGDAYISPDWYGVENQELRGILDRLSENMEDRLEPKIPWKIDKMDEDAYLRMSRQIIPIAMNVSNIEGTWKLSQNKPSDVRIGAMNGAGDAQIGAEVNEIVKWMGRVESD